MKGEIAKLIGFYWKVEDIFFDDIHSKIECKNKVDVLINYENKDYEFTFEEFKKKLGIA